MFRIYLSSCKCLACQNCLPKVSRDEKCALCKASKVSFQPIGHGLSSDDKNLFRTIKEQPTVGKMYKMKEFQTKHLKRASEVNRQIRRFNIVKGNLSFSHLQKLRNLKQKFKKNSCLPFFPAPIFFQMFLFLHPSL